MQIKPTSTLGLLITHPETFREDKLLRVIKGGSYE